METMCCGLIQTWEQLRFCLQFIKDGMLDIEFSDTEHKSSDLGGKLNTQHPILNGFGGKIPTVPKFGLIHRPWFAILLRSLGLDFCIICEWPLTTAVDDIR